MSESIKTGGVGKNPAIEKINQLNELATRAQTATQLEKKAFTERSGKAEAEIKRREQIIRKFSISFRH